MSTRLDWIRFTFAFCASVATCVAPAAEPMENALVGPKRSIVVDKFDSLSTFAAAYGSWDVGGGLSAMLTTALDQSGRFVILERANLDRVIGEQQIKSAGTNSEAGPQLGKVTAAQFIVIGSVTEFGVENKGGGINIGVSGSRGLGGLLGLQKTEGAVALDLRIVDTTTSQVVQTLKVREPISNTSVSANTNYRAMTLGGDSFDNTPLGEATRHAIEKAVAEIVAVAARQPWHALVVEVDGKNLAINAGSGSGLKKGDRFRVERVVNKLTDPATGEVLSVRRKTLGNLEIKSVEGKISFGVFKPTDPQAPTRGDLVVMPTTNN